VIKGIRTTIAAAVVLALGMAGYAAADGASEHEAAVVGKVKPAKLDKKKYKRVALFTGVVTTGGVTGTQANPRSEYISWGKNVKAKLKRAPRCSAALPNGITTEQARGLCPKRSYLGGGTAEIQGPGTDINDVTVAVFNGPGKNAVRLQTYSPTLLAASPTVDGRVVKSKDGRKYGQALSVPFAPQTGSLMIVSFNAKLDRSSKVVKARCKAKKFRWKRTVTYDDGSTDVATLSQRCKRKPKRHHRGHRHHHRS
jgi:hypothetical protein